MAYITDTQLAAISPTPGSGLVGYIASASGAVGRTELDKWREHGALTPEDFGAIGNGSSDDGPALQAWLNALGAGKHGMLGPKTYCTMQALVCPPVNNVTISGVSKYQSVIRYTGSSATVDIILLGSLSSETRGWQFRNFSINSATRMTSGHAMRLTKCIFTQVDDVVLSGQYGPDGQTPPNFTLWNGIHFDGFLYCRMYGSDVKVRAIGVKVAGTNGYGAGLFIGGGGKIAGCGQHGILFGGGCGGVMVDELDIIGNSQSANTYANVWIDTSLSNTGNREIFFGDRCTIDSSVGYGVYVNDTLNGTPTLGPGTLRFTGTWIASSFKPNIHVAAWGGNNPASMIALTGAKLYNGASHGFQCITSNPRVILNGCELVYNQGYAVVASSNVKTRGSLIHGSSAGEWSGTVYSDNFTASATYFQDVNFYALLNGNNPSINFDSNDFIQYTRSLNHMDFYAGGNLAMRAKGDGVLFGNAAQFGDTSFGAYLSGGSPIVNCDANDFMKYDRVNNEFLFYIGGVAKFRINSAGGSNV